MVALSPTLAKYARQLVRTHNLAFPLLPDPGNRIAAQYGLTFSLPEGLRRLYLGFGIDLERYNGDASWSLPMPARYVIDQQGAVRAAWADPDYTIRPDPAETVAALRRLSS